MTRPSWRRLLDTAGLVLLVAVVVPFVVASVPQLVGASQSYTVMSGSMEPAISPGDVVLVREVPPGSIAEGDVVTYEFATAGSTTERRTHRVVEVVRREDGRYFRTKGDANEEADRRLVPAGAVVGRVAYTIPYVGYVTLFASTAEGLLVLVLLPAGALFGSELLSLVAAVRESRAAGSPTADGPEEDRADADRQPTPEGE